MQTNLDQAEHDTSVLEEDFNNINKEIQDTLVEAGVLKSDFRRKRAELTKLMDGVEPEGALPRKAKRKKWWNFALKFKHTTSTAVDVSLGARDDVSMELPGKAERLAPKVKACVDCLEDMLHQRQIVQDRLKGLAAKLDVTARQIELNRSLIAEARRELMVIDDNTRQQSLNPRLAKQAAQGL